MILLIFLKAPRFKVRKMSVKKIKLKFFFHIFSYMVDT